MRFDPVDIPGVHLVEAEPVEDERGVFARTFCAEEFADAGLEPVVAQCSVSLNRRAATLRGMHWQAEPHGEAKLVRCTRGRIFDVAVDVRVGSATFGRWLGFELTESDYRALYLPPGVAHGFLTLDANSEIFYQMSVPYQADAAVGFRWDDPEVGIDWPMPPTVISKQDDSLPSLQTAIVRTRTDL